MDIFNIELQTFQVFLITLFRVGGLFVFAPIYSAISIPLRLKAGLAVFLAVLLFPIVASVEFVVPIDSISYFLILFQEFLVGLTIGFGATLIMGVFQFIGKLLDVTMGLHMASVMDPLNRDQASVSGQLIYVVGIFLLLMTNAHHYVIQAVAKSYDVIPIAGAVFGGGVASYLVSLMDRLFELGFQVAFPIAASLFMITFSLGIIAKAVPQINVFFVGLPLKILTGLFLLMTGMNVFVPVFKSMVLGMHRDLLLLVQAISA